jgi:hypothetical protein
MSYEAHNLYNTTEGIASNWGVQLRMEQIKAKDSTSFHLETSSTCICIYFAASFETETCGIVFATSFHLEISSR